MINRRDAQFILAEIRSIDYLTSQIASVQKEIDDIELRIAEVTVPKSPNGRTEPRGSGGVSAETRINNLISLQMDYEADKAYYTARLRKATAYFNYLQKSYDAEFVKDFFLSQKTHKQLEDEYHVSNAYDRILRIITNCVRRV